MIHLHPSPWELAKLYPTEVALAGDVGEGLLDLLEAMQAEEVRHREEKAAWLAKLRQEYEAAERVRREKPLVADGNPVSGEFLARTMQKTFPSDTIIVDEAIRTSRPLLANYQFTVPGTYYRTGGGGLGWGIPAAMGVSLATPGRKVVALVGDGSALFGIQSLWTAARYRIPVLVVVANNRSYMAVRSALESYGGKAVSLRNFVGTELDDPPVDFVSLARGFGVPGRVLASPEELASALAEGLASGGPFLLDVPVRREDSGVRKSELRASSKSNK